IVDQRKVRAEKSPDNDKPRPAPSETPATSTLTLDEQAVAIFVAHKGNITKKEIALRLGCHEKSLAPKRCPELEKVINAFKAANNPVRGSKDKSGKMEAWDEA